ncbi:hypothetical protein P4O66_009233, partial [Electrophorus voltai]
SRPVRNESPARVSPSGTLLRQAPLNPKLLAMIERSDAGLEVTQASALHSSWSRRALSSVCAIPVSLRVVEEPQGSLRQGGLPNLLQTTGALCVVTLPRWRAEQIGDNCFGNLYQPDYENHHSEVDSAGSYGDQLDYENRHSEVDSTGSYDPYLEEYKGYVECGEYSDVSLRSDRGSVREEDPAMEVEEVPHGDLPSQSDITGSENDEPPAPKALPRARRPGASELPRVTWKEVLSPEEDTPPPKAKSPRVHAPMPKPRRGKKAAAPVPAPEADDISGALPEAHAPKAEQPPLPKTAKDNPPEAGRSPTQPMTGGLAGGLPSSFSGLEHTILCSANGSSCPSPACRGPGGALGLDTALLLLDSAHLLAHPGIGRAPASRCREVCARGREKEESEKGKARERKKEGERRRVGGEAQGVDAGCRRILPSLRLGAKEKSAREQRSVPGGQAGADEQEAAARQNRTEGGYYSPFVF